ncbi:CLUMA_CG012350, isoform A [Clunio marinus]|uniref:CLUMA_CG012350, isoform A n=1 Tax=Clunio marinus TaxID=568069 RepID=A0A1J1IKX6_9DIPT|nr:CLUMA_CG012350, isoform A [Clunio marinus]
MKKHSAIFFFIFLSLIVLVFAHKEGKAMRDVFCNFIEDDRGYVCELTKLKLFSEDDILRFTGEQMSGKSNEDVKYLHIHSSESNIVPSENIFNFFVNLEKLEMKGVGVRTVSTIINCMPLDLIILSDNQISFLDAGTFIECANLEILDLARNEIKKINDNAFSSLKTLRELDLSNNQLDKLTRKSIKPMKNLRKLSFRANKIKELPYNIFNDLFELRNLDLSDNPLTRLDFRSFDITIRIESLKLSGTDINKLHPYTFRNLRRLRFLDISRNDLQHIENELMATNKEVEEIRMNDCGVKSIGRQFFDKLDRLKTFKALGNKCVDGDYTGDVILMRPKFLDCFIEWDKIKERGNKGIHTGDEL